MSFTRHWKDFLRLKSANLEARSVVFYAEDGGSWLYFAPIISELVGTHGKRICYVTSSLDDPVLQMKDSRIQTFTLV